MKVVLLVSLGFFLSLNAWAQGTVIWSPPTDPITTNGLGNTGPISGVNTYRFGFYIGAAGSSGDALSLVGLASNDPLVPGRIQGGSPFILPIDLPMAPRLPFRCAVGRLSRERRMKQRSAMPWLEMSRSRSWGNPPSIPTWLAVRYPYVRKPSFSRLSRNHPLWLWELWGLSRSPFASADRRTVNAHFQWIDGPVCACGARNAVRYNRLMTHRSAVLLLLASAVLWSLAGLLLKSVEWPSMAKAGTRSAIAAIVLWAWLRKPAFTWSATQLGAAVAYAATVSTFVIAVDRTTAANAIFLQYTAPIYVALLGHYFLGERTRRSDWFFIAVALAGIALFFRDQFSPRGLIGMLVALGSGVCFGVMVVLLRKERHGSPASALLLGNVLTAAVGIPFAIGHPLPASHAAIIGVLGVVQLGLPYIFYSIAIRRVTALESILIPMIEPILNPLWVALARGEIPGPFSLLGGALVLGSVLGREMLRRNDRPTEATT